MLLVDTRIQGGLPTRGLHGGGFSLQEGGSAYRKGICLQEGVCLKRGLPIGGMPMGQVCIQGGSPYRGRVGQTPSPELEKHPGGSASIWGLCLHEWVLPTGMGGWADPLPKTRKASRGVFLHEGVCIQGGVCLQGGVGQTPPH